MRKRRVFIGLGVVVAALLLTVAALLGSSWGLGVGIWLAEAFTEIEIATQGLSGSLLGGVRADSIDIEMPGVGVRIEELESAWDLQLAEGAFHLQTLKIALLELEIEPTEDEPEEPLEELPAVDLGIAIAADRIQVSRVEVDLGEGDPTVVTGIELAFTLDGGVLDVTSFAVAVDAIAAKGSLHLDTKSNYQHRVDLAIDLEGKTVAIELVGDLRETALNASAEDWKTEVEGKLLTLLEQPGVDLEIRYQLDPIDASLKLTGAMPVFEVNGRVSIGEQVIGIQELTAEIGESAVDLQGRVVLDTAGVVVSLDETRVGFAENGPVHAIAVWAWAGPVEGPLGASDGRLEIEGSFDELSVTAAGVIPLNGRPFDLVLDALVRTDGAKLEKFSVSGQDMEVALGGEIAWQDGLEVQAEGVLKGLNPEILVPGWPASIDGTLSVSGTDEHLEILLTGLGGHFLDRPLQGEGRVILEDLALAQAKVDLQSGESQIEIDAPAWPDEPILVTLDLRNLGDLMPDLEGSLQGHAKVVPHDSGFEIEAQLDGSSVKWEEWTLASITAEASLDTRPQGDLSARIEAMTIGGPLDLQKVVLDATGKDRVLDFSSELESEVAHLATVGSLDFAEEMTVRLDRLDLSTTDFGDWALTEPTTISLPEAGPQLDPAVCLASTSTRLCADLPESDQIPGNLLIERFPLGLLNGLASASLGQDLTFDGELDGDFTWSLPGGLPVVHGQLRSEGIEIVLGEGEERQILELSGLRLEVHGEEDLALDLRLDAANAFATLNGSIGAWTKPEEARLDLSVDIDLPDLGQFALLVPAVEELKGGVRATIHARGPLDEPELTGQAKVTDLGLIAKAAGTKISQGDLDLRFDENGDIDISGKILFDEGSLDIAGSAQLDPLRADVKMTAADALVVNLPDTRVQVEANLELTIDEEGLELNGDVGILESRIVLGPTTPTVSPSSDVVFVDAPVEEESALEMPIRADLQVRIVEPVSIAGFGLDAEVSGKVQITETPDSPTSASGMLEIEGDYSIYGQTLEISRGRVLFANSSVTDPLLDIEATRETDTALVGVRVGGAVTQPTITFFSNPPMSESEILSILILGYSLSDPDQKDAGALSAALMGLRMTTEGMRSDEPGFLEKLGFTEVGLDVQDDLGGAAFSIGRYLTPKIYLGYAIGLKDSIDVFSLRYELTDRWTVTAESGRETRAKVSYRRETGDAKIPKENQEKEEP